MATQPKNKKLPEVGDGLSAPEFRVFLEHFPNFVLRHHGISRRALWGVGMSLAQHVDYESGTRARATQITPQKMPDATARPCAACWSS